MLLVGPIIPLTGDEWCDKVSGLTITGVGEAGEGRSTGGSPTTTCVQLLQSTHYISFYFKVHEIHKVLMLHKFHNIIFNISAVRMTRSKFSPNYVHYKYWLFFLNTFKRYKNKIFITCTFLFLIS